MDREHSVSSRLIGYRVGITLYKKSIGPQIGYPNTQKGIFDNDTRLHSTFGFGKELDIFTVLLAVKFIDMIELELTSPYTKVI